MAKNKAGRPSWFKVFLHSKAMIDAVPDDVAGKAFKAALRYFETGEVEELDQLTGAVFASLKPHIDEAFEDFRKAVDTGRSGGNKRWGKNDRPPIPSLYPPYTLPIGGPTEADADTEADEDVCVADKPLNHAHFSPPSVGMVREYCTAKGYTTIDPERFVSYYAARGWAVNGTNIVDWRATVDIWNRKDIENNGKTESKHNWTVGTVV